MWFPTEFLILRLQDLSWIQKLISLHILQPHHHNNFKKSIQNHHHCVPTSPIIRDIGYVSKWQGHEYGHIMWPASNHKKNQSKFKFVIISIYHQPTTIIYHRKIKVICWTRAIKKTIHSFAIFSIYPWQNSTPIADGYDIDNLLSLFTHTPPHRKHLPYT